MVDKTFPGLSKIPFEFIIFLAQAFLLFNAGLFVVAEEMTSYTTLITVYMLLLIGGKAFSPGGPAFAEKGIGWSVLWFGVGLVGTQLFLGGWDLLPNIGSIFQTLQFTQEAPIIILITQIFIVASTENLVFFGYLPKIWGMGIIGGFLSAGSFAAFHAFAFQLVIGSIIIAFVAGMIFFAVSKYVDLWAGVGMHVGWNLYALGLLFSGLNVMLPVG
jgi:membrane protease YdiL (CAAX protease family)